jgi:hypothetical protein
MARLQWDQVGERVYETGVDHGVLYIPDTAPASTTQGVVWNGLVSVSESPSGAEATPQYADNIKYLNLCPLRSSARLSRRSPIPTSSRSSMAVLSLSRAFSSVSRTAALRSCLPHAGW